MKVRQIRKEKGVTQDNLAFDACLDRTYIGCIENAKRNFSIEAIYRISRALKVPLYRFFYFKKEPRNL